MNSHIIFTYLVIFSKQFFLVRFAVDLESIIKNCTKSRKILWIRCKSGHQSMSNLNLPVHLLACFCTVEGNPCGHGKRMHRISTQAVTWGLWGSNQGPWSCVEAMLPTVQPCCHAVESKQIHNTWGYRSTDKPNRYRILAETLGENSAAFWRQYRNS